MNRNFYYFSKSKLKLIEVRNLIRKLFAFQFFLSFLFSSLLFGGYFFIKSITGNSNEVYNLKTENRELSAKVSEMLKMYKGISKSIDSLTELNNQLRLATDLPPINREEQKLGVGGGEFDNIMNYSSRYSEIDLDEVASVLDNIQNKLAFEKRNYRKISEKLKSNQKLYAAIPALKPAAGIYSEHGFGMRVHPILGINRMHDGIDILSDIGTPVIAPGEGVVTFCGQKSGYGLCMEIDHGFGYRTLYGHLSAIEVNTGEKVKRGQLVARTGNSGLSSGPHLHYEVQHNGEKVNPRDFIFDDLEVFDLAQK